MDILRSVRQILIHHSSVLLRNLLLPFKVDDLRLLLLQLIDNLLDTKHRLVHATDHVLAVVVLPKWERPSVLHHRRTAAHDLIHSLLLLHLLLLLVVLHPVLSTGLLDLPHDFIKLDL